MNSLQMVADFHHAFSHPVAEQPQPLDTPLAKLRVDLITEERDELLQAVKDNNLVGVVDAVQDLKYVVIGAALALGADLDTSPLYEGEAVISDEDRASDLEYLNECVEELVEAAVGLDFVAFQTSLADIYYAAMLVSAQFRFDDNAHFNVVHLANMRKLGPDGKPIYREDGKVLKPEGWTGPEADHERLLAA